MSDSIKPVVRVQAGSAPLDAKAFVGDSFVNFRANIGYGTNNIASSGTYGFNPVSRNRVMLEWMYRGSWLVRQIIDAVAEDMTRAAVSVDSDLAPDKIDEMHQYWQAHQIWSRLNETIKWSRLYGGSVAIVMIDGQKMDTPLRISTIKKGQFRGLMVLDRWMVWPHIEDVVTELGPDFNKPKYYTIVADARPFPQEKVHHSRVIRFDGIDLPYWQRIAENGWGLSVVEPFFDRMIAYDSVTSGAAQLVYRAHLRVLSVENLRNLIAAGGPAYQGFLSYVQTMRMMQSNEGLTVLDNKDSFQTQTYSFSGLSDMMIQFGQQLSGASGIPLTRLFGQAPAGMNATGESDMRNYYDGINADQETDLRGPIYRLYQITHRSCFEAPLPKGFGFTFNPLYRMNDGEKIGAAATLTAAIEGAVAGGLVNRKTALKELRQGSRITGVWSNITDEDIEEADEPPPSPDMGMGMGAPGEEQAGEPPEPGMDAPEEGQQEAPVSQNDPQTQAPDPTPYGMEPQSENASGPQRLNAADLVKEYLDKKAKGARINALLGKDANQLPLKEVHGLLCIIETFKGTRRLGYGWSVQMPTDYGYISGTSSTEGPHEQMDCFIGEVPESELVWIIEQQDPDTQEFDEHKVMLSFPDKESAVGSYVKAFSDGRGRDRIKNVRRMHVDVLKKWLENWRYGEVPAQAK